MEFEKELVLLDSIFGEGFTKIWRTSEDSFKRRERDYVFKDLEKEKSGELKINVQGIDENSIEINVYDENRIEIIGKSIDKDFYQDAEYFFKIFKKFDLKKAKAKMNKNILIISFPYSEEKEPEKIKIEIQK